MSDEELLPALDNKRRHVRRATQTRAHTCHWPDCPKQVKPALWGCYAHWMKLPARIRRRIWLTYHPGQESNPQLVSEDYIKAAKEAQEWIRDVYPSLSRR